MTTQHKYYNSATKSFKNENLSNMKGYLLKQMELENPSVEVKKIIKENVNRYQNEYKKINGKEDDSIKYN